MSEMQVFNVDGGEWRFGQDSDGTPWAVASDVAKSFDQRDADKVTRLLDEDEKGTRIVGTPGGPQEMKVVFEDGLWELIFRSTKPEAKAIKKRVKAILKQIRETGSYSTQPAFQIPQTYAAALELAALQARQIEAKDSTIAELEPAAEAWGVLAEAKGDYSVREAAQILDRDPAISTGQNRLFATLKDIGWIDGSGQPYQNHVDSGRLVRRTTAYTHPHTKEPVLTSQLRITVKGVQTLRRTLGGSGQDALFGEAI